MFKTVSIDLMTVARIILDLGNPAPDVWHGSGATASDVTWDVRLFCDTTAMLEHGHTVKVSGLVYEKMGDITHIGGAHVSTCIWNPLTYSRCRQRCTVI